MTATQAKTKSFRLKVLDTCFGVFGCLCVGVGLWSRPDVNRKEEVLDSGQWGQTGNRKDRPMLNVGLGGRVSGALTLRASAAARVLLVGAVNGSREARWQEMLLEAGLAHPI